MLARGRVLLPYTISIRQADSLTPEEFDRNGYRIRVSAPYQAATSILALADPAIVPSDLVYALHPADPSTVDPGTIIDGRPTVPANAIRIDVFKHDFDRRVASAGNAGSDVTPNTLLFVVVD